MKKILFLVFSFVCIFSFCSINTIKIYATEGEEVEQEQPEQEENTENTENPGLEEGPELNTEEEQVGFLEANWETICASVSGTFLSLSALLFFVLKAIKTGKNTIDTAINITGENGKATTKLQDLSDNLEKAEQTVEKVITKITDLEEKTEKKLEEIQNNANDEIKDLYKNVDKDITELKEAFIAVINAFKIMVGNNDELVTKGVSEEINKILDKKEVK